MEGYTVNCTDDEEGPVGSAFSLRRVSTVVYGKEDVGDVGEVGEGVAKGQRVRCLDEHEGHARTKKDDASTTVGAHMFMFKVFFPKCNDLSQMDRLSAISYDMGDGARTLSVNQSSFNVSTSSLVTKVDQRSGRGKGSSCRRHTHIECRGLWAF